MASPSMPNRTRISSAIRTMACPPWSVALRALVRVLGSVNRICRDDDVVADNLLDDRSDRLERVPERDLDRLVAGRGCHSVAAGAGVWRRVAAEAAPRSVGSAVSCLARIGDEDPPRVGC